MGLDPGIKEDFESLEFALSFLEVEVPEEKEEGLSFLESRTELSFIRLSLSESKRDPEGFALKV